MPSVIGAQHSYTRRCRAGSLNARLREADMAKNEIVTNTKVR
jgi:hypothetical protein